MAQLCVPFSSRIPLLPGGVVEYECSDSELVPHTDENLQMVCQTSGELIPDPAKAEPTCVRPDTCRVNQFPQHPDYSPNDTSVVFYELGQTIEMKCKDEDLVAEDKGGNYTKYTFGIKCGGTAEAPAFETPAALVSFGKYTSFDWFFQ